MNPTRPPLNATYSQNHTTLWVAAQDQPTSEADAFVYCQLKHRTCRRDSFSHGAHTVMFQVATAARKVLCLPPKPGQMPFPANRQGHPPQSPLRPESEPPFHWPSSMG